MEYILRTHNLTKCFDGQEVVRNINLNIKKGEIYGFLGVNGAGKSTIMKMITTLLQPDAGSITIFGQELGENNAEILKRMGAIIEAPVFYETLTAYENMELHCEYMGMYDKNAIAEAFKLVNLKGIDKKIVSHFSLGMKQRLAIARAIVTKPELLILDEPINGLDAEGIVQVRALLKMLSREYGMTIMISSHILSEIEQIADTIGIISEGSLIREVAMDTVHETDKQFIELVVSDVKTAAFVLESQVGVTNMKIIDDDVIRIYDDRHTIGSITKQLSLADIAIESISQKKTSLEEYFLALTKGDEVHV